MLNYSYFIFDYYFFLPELFLLFCFFFSFFFCIIKPSFFIFFNKKVYFIKTKFVIFLISYIFLISFFLFYNFLDLFWFNSIILFNYSLKMNLYLLFIKLLIIFFFLIFLNSIFFYFKYEKIKYYEFIFILYLTIFSLFIFLSSFNLIVFFLSIELLSLSLYILVGLKTKSKYSTEASLKYFIIGAFSSGLLLYGISFLYGTLGVINFDDIEFLLFFYNLETFSFFMRFNIILSCLFIISGFFFKLIIVPFHFWAPDVYEGSPTIITLFLSIFPKIVFFLMLIFLIFNFFSNLYFFWYNLFILCSFFSLILGTFSAFYQIKLKRLIVFSAIVNNSYFLLSLSNFTFIGLESFFIYFFIYLFLIFGIFLIILSLRDFSNLFLIKKIYSLKYFSFINLYCAIILGSFVFSLAGIPPLLGFFGKFFIFYSLIDNSLFFISFFFIILSVFSVFYYIRLINLMFFSVFNNFFFIEFWTFFLNMPKIYSFWVSLFFLFNFLFILDPSPIFLFCHIFVINFIIY